MLQDGGNWKYYLRCKEPDTRSHIAYDSLKIYRLGKSVEKDRRVWVARTQGVAVGSDCLPALVSFLLL